MIIKNIMENKCIRETGETGGQLPMRFISKIAPYSAVIPSCDQLQSLPFSLHHPHHRVCSLAIDGYHALIVENAPVAIHVSFCCHSVDRALGRGFGRKEEHELMITNGRIYEGYSDRER